MQSRVNVPKMEGMEFYTDNLFSETLLIKGCKYWSPKKLNATVTKEKSRDHNEPIKNYHIMRTFR